MLTPEQRACAAVERLEQEYPDAICALQYTKDYELLFATRLSAQCTDKRVNIITKDLYAKFPTLEAFALATEGEIEQIIRPCGLGNSKARDIHAAAVYLLAVHNGKVPGTMKELLKIPGVGRKTANLILGDLYHRIGLVDGIKEPAKVEKALRPLIPPEKSSDFCHRLVLHGRDVCTARKPYCERCCLKDICKTGSET